MNRTNVLAARDVLRDKKNFIMEVVTVRLDGEMYGKSVEERREKLLYGNLYTEEEKKALSDLDEKIDGYTHMLKEGFFKPKQAPEKDEEKEELLY